MAQTTATAAAPQTRDQKLLEEIKGNFEQLKQRRQPYEPTWDELVQMFLPRLSLTTQGAEAEGEKRTKAITDPKPQRCRRIASAGYQGWMFPRGQVWCRVNFETEEVAQLPDARAYSQKLERVGYAELRRGRFYKAAESWVDIALTVGTAALFVGPGTAACEYLAIHHKEFFLALGAEGKPDTGYRHYQMTGRQILQAFPDAPLTEAIREKLKKNAYQKQDILWAVGPRTDRVEGMIDDVNMPFYSIYILEGEDLILKEGGFPAFPFVVFQPQTMTDEDYGRSQGWDMLTVARRLQVIAKSSTKGSQLAVQSPLNVPREMMETLDLTPWGPNPYGAGEARMIKPILTGIDVKPAMTLEERLHQQLEDGWDVPFFQMMMAMSGAANRTATEVYETAGERSVLMGPTVGGLEDCLLQVWDLTLMYAAAAGRAPKIPEALSKTGAKLKADMVGPLSMLQKRYHGQQAIVQTLAQASIILKIDPSARYVVNTKKTMRKFLDAGGFDAECINDDKTIQQLEAADAKAQQAAAMMKLLETMGKAGLTSPQAAAAQGAAGGSGG